jgi:hypothetical protein
VDIAAANHVKVVGEPRVTYHGSRVTAHKHGLVGHKVVVVVEVVHMPVARQRAFVRRNLAVVFTECLQ